MSIIADALHKQTRTQRHALAKPPDHRIWKLAFFTALLLIIVLLMSVFLLLFRKPVTSSVTAPIERPALIQKHLSSAKEVSVEQNKLTVKSISRISFVTRELPDAEPDEEGGADRQVVTRKNKPVSSSSVQENTPQVNLAEVPEVTPGISEETSAQAMENIDYSAVSAPLKKRFQDALSVEKADVQAVIKKGNNNEVPDLYLMERHFQQQVPVIHYEFHVYSSQAEDRWIRINSEDLREGEFDSSGKIQVIDISPKQTVFRCAGEHFYLKSLTDWQGS